MLNEFNFVLAGIIHSVTLHRHENFLHLKNVKKL